MESRADCNVISAGLEDYFTNEFNNIKDSQLSELPLDFKLFKRTHGKDVHYEAPKTTFVEKLSLLWKIFDKDIYIVIKDREDYFTVEDFAHFEKYGKKREHNENDAKTLTARGQLILGNEEICRGFHYQRMLSHSPIYQFVNKVRGAKENEVSKNKKEVTQFAKMLLFYEANKKKMARDMKMTMPDWYILLHMADGLEKKASVLYAGKLFDAYNSSRAQMLRGIKRMTELNYIQRFGKTRSATYRMTATGYDLFYKCLSKYVLNY